MANSGRLDPCVLVYAARNNPETPKGMAGQAIDQCNGDIETAYHRVEAGELISSVEFRDAVLGLLELALAWQTHSADMADFTEKYLTGVYGSGG